MPRLLVVDDDQGTRETSAVILRDAGYAVDLAHSGTAAITALSNGGRVDGLLLDLRLGDMTGYDVLRWMRRQPMRVPTAVVTAFRGEFDPDEAIALGALAYADQPLTIGDILALAESLTTPPSPSDDPVRLHTRLLAGQPGALDCLVSEFLRVLPPKLKRAFPRVPWDFAEDAATDACMEYAAQPARFDSSHNVSLIDFVYLIARRNLANRVRAEMSLKNREVRYADEHTVKIPAPGRRVLQADLLAAVLGLTMDLEERRAAERWLSGEGTDTIAEALGIGHRPAKDRRREVKRFKDRLLKRLSRHFRPLTRD